MFRMSYGIIKGIYLNARYNTLNAADRRSISYRHETERTKAYLAFEREIRNKMYSEIAQKCIKTAAEDSGKARKTRRKKGTSLLLL